MTKRFQEDHDAESYHTEEEIADDHGFDLRGKSLKNTEKKIEEKKPVLPMKAIMSQILDKPTASMPLGVPEY